MIRVNESPSSRLAEIIAVLRCRRTERSLAGKFAAAGIVLPVGAMLLFTLGMLGVQVMIGVVLAGWLCWSEGRRGQTRDSGGEAANRASLVALHAFDAGLLLGAGAFCHLVWGLPALVMALAVAAAMTNYMVYYSGVAFLKSVPGDVRTASPRSMVELDHAFLASGGMWGAGRELVFGSAALGLLIGRPEIGFAVAVLAGNFYWIYRAGGLWQRMGLK